MVLLATLLAAWIIAAVTRPLAVLSEDVARAARAGFGAEAPAPLMTGPANADDEFGRLQAGFQALLTKLHAQWDRLRRLDAFRRESVSNLSHDLRSPLTAAAASLETLQQRWRLAAAKAAADGGLGDGAGGRTGGAIDPDRAEEARLVDLALRNTHNAARLVRSLGDLAVLDEDSFRLRLARLDLGEMLDDIAMRFAERAARQGVAIRCDLGSDEGRAGHDGQREGDPRGHPAGEIALIDAAARVGVDGGLGDRPAGPSLVAEVDVELIERAIANLLDNALRFTPAGGRIVLSAHASPGALGGAGAPAEAGVVHVAVQDTGCGIVPADLEHLFDRHFSGRAGHAARSEGGAAGNQGLGLGLAIVRRIVELHGGHVAVQSLRGEGTTVTLDLPMHRPGHPPPAPSGTE
ncbi:MAG: HAMP domain-containing histidine kinase [Rubrivivax sp.]|nr:HAMP domain-containing histidine kinase [Rubrivivax sp.]